MPDTDSTICSETGRTFTSTEATRASEGRFREIQVQCDAGELPELLAGDVIYVDTSLYVSHGIDDFRGGLAEVVECKLDIGYAKPAPFVRLAQDQDTWHNWKMLAADQKKMRAEFGKSWAHPDPDFRPEFNEW